MTKGKLENYIFDYIVEICIELNLYKSDSLDELYKEVKCRLNSKMYLRFDKDYVTGYINIYGCENNKYEINLYISEIDIKLSAIEIIREGKLRELLK